MMKLSTKGRYGLRCMVDLALNATEQHVPLGTIAERQGLSILYLEQVFSALRKAGLVKSIKGAGGGYILARPASEISAGDVLRSLEGELTLISGRAGATSEEENAIERCLKEQLWMKIDEAVLSLLDSASIERLAEEARKAEAANVLVYYI